MYGAPPFHPGFPIVPETPSVQPLLPDLRELRDMLEGARLQPALATPETAEVIAKRIDERIAWLERELSMHGAWKAELATLRRMRGTP